LAVFGLVASTLQRPVQPLPPAHRRLRRTPSIFFVCWVAPPKTAPHKRPAAPPPRIFFFFPFQSSLAFHHLHLFKLFFSFPPPTSQRISTDITTEQKRHRTTSHNLRSRILTTPSTGPPNITIRRHQPSQRFMYQHRIATSDNRHPQQHDCPRIPRRPTSPDLCHDRLT
jgi:hypothetical protein